MTKRMYVALRVRAWEDLSLQLWGIPGSEDLTRVSAPEGVAGLMLVFDSMDALRKVYPNVDERQVLVLQKNDAP